MKDMVSEYSYGDCQPINQIQDNDMYMGHFAVGLAAKPHNPKVSLGILLISTQVIDILYAISTLVGISQPGIASPWDHGLVMSLVWSVVAFTIAFFYYRDVKSSIFISVLIFSHWICDFIAYDKALPIAFNDTPRLGIGLFNSVPIFLIGDFGLFGGALAYYLFNTKANDSTGKWAPWILVAYLLVLILTLLLPGKLKIFMAVGMVMVVPIGIWIDRHRSLDIKQR